ncbi:cancer/testis antigen 1-like [Tamandua tetradactyla]|uniref:cancer/testis antigen 1-like n=1 Tax=Tamandua tetradactyla TaxID=48850 RepID=UPI004053AF9A
MQTVDVEDATGQAADQGGQGAPDGGPEDPEGPQNPDDGVGDTTPEAQEPGRLLKFSLTMRFPSRMEARMARRSLALYAQPHGPVEKLAVVGNTLSVRLTAADPDQLQISVTACMDHLYLLARTMRHFAPPLCL